MIANLVASVPRILLSESKNGALISIALGTIAGVMITFVTVRFFKRFPGQDLIGLLKNNTSKWFSIPVTLYFAIHWYIAGLITLVTFTFILVRFLTPETSIITIAFSLLIIVSFGILIKTKSVLYMLEITIVLFFPFIIFLFLKSFFNDVFELDYVRVAIMYFYKAPSYSAFTASSYLFLGIVNLVVFNQFFTKKIKLGVLPLTAIGLIGAFFLFLTYFIPIGIGGFDEIDKLIYPWISTSDSIRMRFGIVERLMFIFLLIFLAVAILSIVIHWHISAKLFESVFGLKKLKWKSYQLSPLLFTMLFGIFGVLTVWYLTEDQLFSFTSTFFNVIPIFFGVLVIVFSVVKRKVKQ